ncbi:4'-phosphopantetheinyl transferase superfamily protein [Streptomyces sp. NPDC002306]
MWTQERNQPLPDRGALDLVTVAEEQTRLPMLAAQRPDVCWDRLLFSAKESVYKAWYPLNGQWLDFVEQVVISVDPAARAFTARLLVPDPVVASTRLCGFSSGWRVRNGLLVTAIAVPSQAVRSPDPPSDGREMGSGVR